MGSCFFSECKNSLKHDQLETQMSHEILNINSPKGGWSRRKDEWLDNESGKQKI